MSPKEMRAFLLLALGAATVGLFLLLSDVVKAASTEITWTAPTKRCDGTALTNLTGYSLTYGQRMIPLPTAPLAYTVTGLAPGDWWFSLAAVDAEGKRSEFVTVTRTVQPAEFVTVGGPVFRIVNRTDRFLLVSVGSVPPGVQCIAAHSVNGNYAVPRAAVTWAGTVRPDVVVAQCR